MIRRVQSTLLSTVWICLKLFTWKLILNKIQFKITLAAVWKWVGCAWKGERRQNRGSKKTQQAALKVIQAKPGSILSWCKREETEKSAQMGNTIWRQKSWDKVPWKVKERKGIKGVSQASGLSKGVETEKTGRGKVSDAQGSWLSGIQFPTCETSKQVIKEAMIGPISHYYYQNSSRKSSTESCCVQRVTDGRGRQLSTGSCIPLAVRLA